MVRYCKNYVVGVEGYFILKNARRVFIFFKEFIYVYIFHVLVYFQTFAEFGVIVLLLEAHAFKV